MACEKISYCDMEKLVCKSSSPVLLCFLSKWCGSYRKIKAIVEQLSTEMEGQIVFYIVDVDEEHQIATDFKIVDIPTFALLYQGVVRDISYGIQTKEEILGILS